MDQTSLERAPRLAGVDARRWKLVANAQVCPKIYARRKETATRRAVPFTIAQVGGTSQHVAYLCRVHHLGQVEAECTHASIRRLEGAGDRTLAAADIHNSRLLVQRGVHHLGVCTPVGARVPSRGPLAVLEPRICTFTSQREDYVATQYEDMRTLCTKITTT
eukprot:7269777-Pyramimonas_sp.AAC.1